MNFKEQFNQYRNIVNDEINSIFCTQSCLQKEVYDAMTYSITAGGKRIRPVFTIATAEMLGADLDSAKRIGIAIECIHTYSLIHDDLPCMDNDDLRRGLPTCHKKFGEATALLAGDGLLTFAFELLTDVYSFNAIPTQNLLRINNLIAKAAGCAGMIGGQVVDLQNENKTSVSEETLTYMHSLKTGALIKASVLSGAFLANPTDSQIDALSRFADGIGLAFQVQDDILDCVGNTEVLGKPIGSDKENNKTTYVTLLGLDNARKKAEGFTKNAISALDEFGNDSCFLKEFAKFLLLREN